MKTTMTPGLAAGAYALTQKMSSNPSALVAKQGEKGNSFADVLEATVGRAHDAGKKSDALAMRAASAQPTDLVEVVTAVAESEAAIESLVAVRDRVVAAYEEIMRMPI
ncbi:MAG: flagellar hook-basal body complex protein FliE [Hyphomicrobiales bacterium]|uniref:flagellar hook-basal body complex protein FliE n=1 Tax=Rhabdaerophilum calidifontis TaxID=2604328 RepID=UPI001FE5B261|nr:flagellar hook-basal body complex protein FliE [Rhabdaerophilum calidifontis]MCA1952896.1 flagellar hook-basal body complex protein FliE [Hyphomicrobiales bacterium]MCA1998595.1 flagellar hook-basal body complex protein FliE [Hyphomicrobiales bacterium]